MEKGFNLAWIIRDKFRRGYTKEETFQHVFIKCDLTPPSVSTISNWFDRLHAGDALLESEIGASDYSLLYSIIVKYTMFMYAISKQEREKSEFGHRIETIIQQRFNLTAKGSTNSFEVLDAFNDNSRILQSTIDKSEQDPFYYPTFIGHDRMLLIVIKDDGDHLLLLNFDFDQLQCSVLDSIHLDFVCHMIVLDSTNSTQFLLRGGDDGNPSFGYKGHVSNDQISIQSQQIEFGAELFYGKVIGNRFIAFQPLPDEDDWLFVEYDLSQNVARKVEELSCSSSIQFKSYEDGVWSDNKLYAVCDNESGAYFSVVVFDSTTLSWAKTNVTCAGHAEAFAIDDNEILTISATDRCPLRRNPDIKIVYRFPMRKPDKLRYIAWSKIRREALFFRSKLYEKLMPLLPLNSEFRLFDEEG